MSAELIKIKLEKKDQGYEAILQAQQTTVTNLQLTSEKDAAETSGTVEVTTLPLPAIEIVKKENNVTLEDKIDDGDGELEDGELNDIDTDKMDTDSNSNNVPERETSPENETTISKKKHKGGKHKHKNKKRRLSPGPSSPTLPKPVKIKLEPNVDKISANDSKVAQSIVENEPEASISYEIPLVRDYNHKSISVKPKIVKCEGSEILPKPINIKLEPETTTTTNKKDVLTVCAEIIERINLKEKQKYSTQFFYTPTKEIQPVDQNRSPLLLAKSLQYRFSSTSPEINFKSMGLISQPHSVDQLAQVIGFKINKIYGKNNDLKIIKQNDTISNINSTDGIPFYTSVASQTDQLPCSECLIRKLQKHNHIHTQTFNETTDRGMNTDNDNELPIINKIYSLNVNQQIAINDFYEEIISSKPATANDKLRLRDRLLHIFESSYQPDALAITPTIIAPPPPPVIPQQSYASSVIPGYSLSPVPPVPQQIFHPQYPQYLQQGYNIPQQFLENEYTRSEQNMRWNDPRSRYREQ